MSNFSVYYVGIDGGGTKTRAICSERYGENHREITLGPCTLAAQTALEAFEVIRSAVGELEFSMREVKSLCVAIAGWSFEQRRMELKQHLDEEYKNASISLIPDFIAAFRNAQPENHGIHVIAGTGSVAYGYNSHTQRSHRAGGYGYLIDDSGSGYGVGRSAIASCLRSIDGTGDKTILVEKIADKLGLLSGSWENFVSAVYGGAADRVTIASLSQMVAECALDGDEVSKHILFRAGGALAKLVEAVHNELFSSPTELNDISPKLIISRSGGLWKAGSDLANVFERSVARFAPLSIVGDSRDVDCALGALQIAVDQN